jgi:hypothetical protein|eukprot:g5058.t1
MPGLLALFPFLVWCVAVAKAPPSNTDTAKTTVVEKDGSFHYVTATSRENGYHTYEKKFIAASPETVLVTNDLVKGVMVSRSGYEGDRATTSFHPPKELAHGMNEISMTAMAVQWLSEYPSSQGVYFSDGNRILRKRLMGAANASPQTVAAESVIDGVCRIDISGVNLGKSQQDMQEVQIFGAPCTNLEYKNSTSLVCFSGLKSIVKHPDAILPDDIVVITRSGGASESRHVLNYRIRETEGYSAPIVSSARKTNLPFSPRALAIDPAREHIYWSDTAERTVRRSKLDGSKVELIVQGDQVAGEVCGLAVDTAGRRLFFSDANSGALYSVSLRLTDQDDGKYVAKALLKGLRDPRGIALDVAENTIYFVEESGKVYLASMDGSNLQKRVASRKPLFKRLIYSGPSNIRMDTISLDLRGPRRNHKIFWAEMNSNLIMRARKDGSRRVAVAGMDGSQIWPRFVAHDDETGKLFYSSFLGSIYRFTTSLAHGTKEPEDMEAVHNNMGPGSNDLYLEIQDSMRTGGSSYFLSI